MGFPGYPKTILELSQWFPDDGACRRYLEQLWWPDGFVCPSCGGKDCWRMAKGVIRCKTCRGETSVTAGTIFADTRTPLPIWFHAAWRMVDSQNGISARTLRKSLGIEDYRLAFRILHRLRRVVVDPDRSQLVGPVEVDDIYVGGNELGVIGRETRTKSVVGVAVEAREYEKETRRGLKIVRVAGRVRLGIMPDAGKESFRDFVNWAVEPGSIVYTDSHPGIQPLEGFEHRRFNLKRSGVPAHRSLPHVHRVASLLKRWLNGTHQGAATRKHLSFYLDEFTWRFNRRHWQAGARFRRLLERAVLTEQVTYEQLKGGLSQWQPEAGRPLHPTA